jgi:hypothetical protein|tara:strand:+ start:593 stop:778 length:186 start_codon:yes stop_codon:yes gene_type:complete
VADLVTKVVLRHRVVGRKKRLQVLVAQILALHREKAKVTASGLGVIVLVVVKEPLNADQMI